MKKKLDNIKKILESYPLTYQVIKYIYRLIRIDYKIYKYRRKKVRENCYLRYENGERLIKKSYGNISLVYEAVSAKNFWHLSTGNQNEERFLNKFLETHVHDGMTIFDIGGHTGQYTIPLAKKVGPNGKVYVFEPDEIGQTAIKNNCKINNISNVKLLKLAVTDKNEKVKFYIRPDKDTHSIFKETSSPSPTGKQICLEVDSMCLDSLIENQIIENKPDLVKIDTEGAEIKILRGAKKISNHVNLYLVEIHEDALILEGFKNPFKSVEEELHQLGFFYQKYVDNIHIIASKEPFR